VADRVADAVMRMPEPQVQRQAEEEEEETLQTKPLAEQITPFVQVQRQEEPEEEEETLQAKPLAEQITPLVQRQVEPEKEEKNEELIQAKIARDVTPDVTPAISSSIQSLQGGGRPLSGLERSFFELRFGADFSNVRVHNDTQAANVARSVNARAFTLRNNIVFGAGEYCPDASSGRKLLAHELTHVVQQSGGATLFSTGKKSEKTISNSEKIKEFSGGKTIVQRDLDRDELDRRALQIYNAVEVINIEEGATDEAAIIRALQGLTSDDAEELQRIYSHVYSPRREGRSLPADLIVELEDPIHRYRAFNLLHYLVQAPGAPPLGVSQSHVSVEPEIREVVPGSQITYIMETQEMMPTPNYRYQWIIRSDPARVRQRRSTTSGQDTPYFIEGPRTATWEHTWEFSGSHTVVCELHIGRRLVGYYEYRQVVRETAQHAAENFEETAEPDRPDLYIARLEFQLLRLRAGDAQQNADQITLLTERIRRTRLLLDVPGEFETRVSHGETGAQVVPAGGPGPSRPIKALLIPTVRPEPMPLRLYVMPERNSRWAIIDLTDPERGSYGPYEGEPGSGLQGEEAIRSAIQAAWNTFVANNQHPVGQLVGEPPAEFGFREGTRWNVHNDGISDLEEVSRWFSRVGLVLGLGALAATLAVAPAPGSRVAAVLLLTLAASAATSATATSLEMLDRARYGDLRWDTETALDLLELAASLAIFTGSVGRLGVGGLSTTGLRSAVLYSEGFDTGTDLASGVILTAVHSRRIQQIRDSSIPEEQKEIQIYRVLRDAVSQGGLILLGVASVGGRGLRRGQREPIGPQGSDISFTGGVFSGRRRRGLVFGRVVFENDYIRLVDENTGQILREGSRQWGQALRMVAQDAEELGMQNFVLRAGNVINPREVRRLVGEYRRFGVGEFNFSIRGTDPTNSGILRTHYGELTNSTTNPRRQGEIIQELERLDIPHSVRVHFNVDVDGAVRRANQLAPVE
jgi:hypothetical protein